MTAISTDTSCRRFLTVTPAPAPGLMTMATMSASLDPTTALAVSYVPDKLVLTRAGFDAYVAARADETDRTPEALAALVAGDVANELVPKWLRVTVNRQTGGVVNHSVTVEDRQPGWNHQSSFPTT